MEQQREARKKVFLDTYNEDNLYCKYRPGDCITYRKAVEELGFDPAKAEIMIICDSAGWSRTSCMNSFDYQWDCGVAECPVIMTHAAEIFSSIALPELALSGLGRGATNLSKLGGGRGQFGMHGGFFAEEASNAAGGRIFTSSGNIAQKDFDHIVENAAMRGDDIHILSGNHGYPDGLRKADASLYADDVARYGTFPNMHIYDMPSMSEAQIKEVMQKPGVIIGGFCNSQACLAPYR
ncbi:hypothetical protein [Actinoplanes utahensis]|uniref:hypothetical protein n=1 Tax=Actinoplanes utahensis TaxID=1869 RepID=UPI00126A0C98|nr:hypothetical protein [Actinoplanes utahensis]